ncbi:MAG: glycosyl transferase family 2 [Crocinitomicaceae bacterium]|jgi:cellulose synthase/poly-beta-1,6-N-acetylglucosamine synthase-like glycosyltransferase|nr:glycosyl transferase family 2 [Crocinitomicaceae bacterium]
MELVAYIIIALILFYCASIMLSYFVLGLISFVALRKYVHRNKNVDYNDILPSDIAPSVSLIAPAYNEGMNIVENIRSLLSLHYSNYEVIIVNDGSKDNTLEKSIEAYDLEKVDFAVNPELPSQEIRGVYKSKLPAFRNLLLVDKVNGGKADALNAGINVSRSRYVACIDVDCILEQDSILKMVKPFLENKERVIATGGVIRIVNSCVVHQGSIKQVNVPKSFFARTQVLEYFRAFLLGRIAWNHMDGLLLISGAFGMFDKEILVLSGGYDHRTVGEDMELLVRMRRYMLERGIPYKVGFIPDPLCWTEAPEDINVLSRQRNRWTRGTIETLRMHRRMFLNPKYKVLGMVSYPYWLLYEMLAPVIEFTGWIYLLAMAVFGLVNWPFFMLLVVFVYSFAVMFNFAAIQAEEYTFNQYKRLKDIWKLVGTALLEPILFHPIVVVAAIRGNIDLVRGKKKWGEMTRKGLGA